MDKIFLNIKQQVSKNLGHYLVPTNLILSETYPLINYEISHYTPLIVDNNIIDIHLNNMLSLI